MIPPCHRTRIKICGLTRPEDVAAAVACGADALGFILYPASPRYVDLARLEQLVREVPPFIATVGLFVNASRAQIDAVRARVSLSLFQFHGDETLEQCRATGMPYLKALRVHPDLDLIECSRRYPDAAALLLDAWVEGYGGGGKAFDWSLIPEKFAPRVVLSGGLNAQNVADAVAQVHPYAVDVSSGVESAKGIKDAGRIRDFCAAVRAADDLS